MTVSVLVGDTWRYAESREEVSALISDVLATLASENVGSRWIDVGEEAWFHTANRRLCDADRCADSFLKVAVNRSTGYGALTWAATDRNPKKGEVYERLWISDNPEPPAFDPRVVSDVCYPLFHDRASALPLDRVRAAIEEFCAGTSGDRPESIPWVQGLLDGQRVDRDPIVEFVEFNDPWA